MKIRMISILVICLYAGVLFSQDTLQDANKKTSKKEKRERVVDPSRSSLSVCPGGIAFGIISANYEYMVKPKHGLVFRGDYEMVPKTYSDANIEPYGYAFTFNYRYHMQGGMNSLFVGAYSRYRIYRGSGVQESDPFEFKTPDITLGINAGKKWVWKSGFTATFALGYGYMWDKMEIDNPTPEIEESVQVFIDEYDFISPFIGELSIGYSF